MNIFIAVSLILAAVSTYMIVIEAFSVAFKLTGMATSRIKFQVASMFTGAGFTTQESELIVNDEKRRRIAVACMYTGHIFSVAIMGLVINVFFSVPIAPESNKMWYYIVFGVACAVFLSVLFIKIPPINRRFQRFLERIAINASRRSKMQNIITVLDYYGKHAIVEVTLNKIPPYAIDISLYEMKLTKKYAINILSIRRNQRVVEVSKDTMFRKGDDLVIYGLINDIKAAFVDVFKDNNNVIVINHKVNELSVLSNYGSNALMEVEVDEVPKELEGVKMKDSHLSDRYSINIVVIKRKDEYLFADKDTIVQAGDKLTLFGPLSNIRHLFQVENIKE